MTATTTWKPSLGAWVDEVGTHFCVWAPQATAVALVVEGGAPPRPLAASESGYFTGMFPDLTPGTEYRYLLDGRGRFPDPASRFQPHGVHGPSSIVDGRPFDWTVDRWPGIVPDALVLYELHVGTFTPEGTFAAAAERLERLARLGVTAIELMPVADFPGRWNWGYDGVALFAPSRCYGTPDDLRPIALEGGRLDAGGQLKTVSRLDLVLRDDLAALVVGPLRDRQHPEACRAAEDAQGDTDDDEVLGDH